MVLDKSQECDNIVCNRLFLYLFDNIENSGSPKTNQHTAGEAWDPSRKMRPNSAAENFTHYWNPTFPVRVTPILLKQIARERVRETFLNRMYGVEQR